MAANYFGARYYAPTLGRFLTPDWSATPEAIPYANLENPQSLNLYQYAGNNPVTITDPDGHCWPWCTVLIGAAAGAVVGAGEEWLSEKISGQATNWTKIGNASLAGGATGALIGAIGPEAGAVTRTGFAIAGGTVGGAIGRLLNGGKALTIRAVAQDAAISAALPAATAKLAEVEIASRAIQTAATQTMQKGVETIIVATDNSEKAPRMCKEQTQCAPIQQPTPTHPPGSKPTSGGGS